MARTDTLTHFLADVAGAIRTAEGSSGAIQASAFDTRIEALSGGGGGSSYAPSYISFQYYDGSDLTYETQNLDTSNMTSFYNMFNSCTSLVDIDVSGWDTSNVTTMSNMFSMCSSLSTIDLSTWDTTSLEDASYMFSGCGISYLDIRGFDFTSILDYSGIFDSVTTGATIIVADDTQKDLILADYPDMEYVMTVAELEELQNS